MNIFTNQGMVLLGDALLRATVLLGLAALLAALLRRGPAAVRHLVWTLGLLGALCVPLLTVVLPRLALPGIGVSGTAAEWAQIKTLSPLLLRKSGPGAKALPDAVPIATLTPKAALDGIVAEPPRALWWAVCMGAAWLLGFAMVLARLCAGGKQVRRMAASSSLVTKGALAASVDAARRAMPTEQAVVFRRASAMSDVTVPMSWGVRFPVVLLPAEAVQWPPERVHAALLHEIAHVRRRDWPVQMLLQIACAVLWFHPLAWLAARRARAESEQACDNLVLRSGMGAADYAGHLVEVARGVCRQRTVPGAALAMTGQSSLGRRLQAVLDPKVHRGSRTPGVTAAMLIVMAGCACGVSSLGFAASAGNLASGAESDLRGKVVVVDAGHGGDDSGAVGAGGVMEKTLNLAIAQKLRVKLESHGATVLMTRDDDSKPSINARPQFANAHHADYFVSIHCDSKVADIGGKRGALIFYHGSSPSRRQLATRVDIGMAFATQTPSNIASDFTRFPMLGFGVLRGAAMPAVLVECGNMAIPQDLARLQSPNCQQQIAEGIAAGLAAFKAGGSASETENHFAASDSTAKWLQEARASSRLQQGQAAGTKAWNKQHPREGENNF